MGQIGSQCPPHTAKNKNAYHDRTIFGRGKTEKAVFIYLVAENGGTLRKQVLHDNETGYCKNSSHDKINQLLNHLVHLLPFYLYTMSHLDIVILIYILLQTSI